MSEAPLLAYSMLLKDTMDLLFGLEHAGSLSKSSFSSFQILITDLRTFIIEKILDDSLLVPVRLERHSGKFYLYILSQYLRSICLNDANMIQMKGQLIISSIKRSLLAMSTRDAFHAQLISTAWSGKLGGNSTEMPPHAYSYITSQCDALETLVTLVSFNPSLSDVSLELLLEYRNICITEMNRMGNDLSCIILEKMEVICRRIIALSSNGNTVAKDALFQHEKHINSSNKLLLSSKKKLVNSIDLLDSDTPQESLLMPSLLATSTSTELLSSDSEDHHHKNILRYIRPSLLTHNVYEYFGNENDCVHEFSLFFHGESAASNAQSMNSTLEKFVCAADIFGVTDDVIESHFPVIAHKDAILRIPINENSNNNDLISNDSEKAELMRILHDLSTRFPRTRSNRRHYEMAIGALSCALADEEDIVWTDVSGSSDLMNVAAYVRLSAINMKAEVKVRVVNTAGFKIPFFSIQLLISSDHDSSGNAVSMVVNGDVVLEGVEYLLPYAMAERTFTLNVQRFSSYSIIVRILYPDVSISRKQEFFPPIATSNSLPGMKSEKHQVSMSSVDGPLDDLNDNNNDTLAMANTTSSNNNEKDLIKIMINCNALLVSVVELLLPYGAGTLSAFRQWFSNSSPCDIYGNNESDPSIHNNRSLHDDDNNECYNKGGIPKSVYNSLWSRLRHSCSHPISAVLPCDMNDLPLDVAVSYASHRRGPVHTNREYTSQQARVHLEACGTQWTRSFISQLAWCFQTWWGDEIAILISATRVSFPVNEGIEGVRNAEGSSRHVYWSGKLFLRASSKTVLECVVQDIDNVIYTISHGLISLSENNGWQEGSNISPPTIHPYGSIQDPPKLMLADNINHL